MKRAGVRWEHCQCQAGFPLPGKDSMGNSLSLCVVGGSFEMAGVQTWIVIASCCTGDRKVSPLNNFYCMTFSDPGQVFFYAIEKPAHRLWPLSGKASYRQDEDFSLRTKNQIKLVSTKMWPNIPQSRQHYHFSLAELSRETRQVAPYGLPYENYEKKYM